MAHLIRTSEEITASWLGAVTGRDGLADLTVTAIGTGQMSRTLRVAFRSGGEREQVVVKIPATDETSRSTGAAVGIYARDEDGHDQVDVGDLAFGAGAAVRDGRQESGSAGSAPNATGGRGCRPPPRPAMTGRPPELTASANAAPV